MFIIVLHLNSVSCFCFFFFFLKKIWILLHKVHVIKTINSVLAPRNLLTAMYQEKKRRASAVRQVGSHLTLAKQVQVITPPPPC